MKLDLITKKQDEFYTPKYAVKPILKYIPEGSKVLCPFDTRHSNFVKMLSEKGCSVDLSHIEDGVDFFSMEKPVGYDFVISNPHTLVRVMYFKDCLTGAHLLLC